MAIAIHHISITICYACLVDTKFRQIQRAAQQAGRGSVEDVEYISVQRKMGLDLSRIVAASELGDLSAYHWLVSQEIISPEDGSGGMVTAYASLHSVDTFRNELFQLLNRCVVPMALSIKWIIGCEKRVLDLVYTARTGRGGLLFTKRSDLEGMETLAETSALLAGTDGWEVNPEHESYLQQLRQYPSYEVAEIPLGIRQHILSHLIEAAGGLLEIIVICKVAATTKWQELSAVHQKPGDALVAQIIAEHLDPIVRHIISRSINPPYSMGKNADFIAHRQQCLQHFADILLNRSWLT